MSGISELEPRRVFYWFEQISRIPRGSGNMKKISDFLVDFARERQLEYFQDRILNVIIVKEASEGYEKEEPVILQGHMDMVAVRTADCKKDMKREGPELTVKDGYLSAEGTSLGGDDGIAVAYMLALLEDDEIAHPRLEAVFTVDEETGMDGARFIDLSALKGKSLLNMDSEEEGIFLAGCAGGGRVSCSLKKTVSEIQGERFELSLSGFTGGHSGTEIQKPRINANIALAEILYELAGRLPVCLCEAEGGTADNAIPVQSRASFLISGDGEETGQDEIREICTGIFEKCKTEWEQTERSAEIRFEHTGESPVCCVSSDDTKEMLRFVLSLPNGVQKMSEDLPGLVETSLNMGMIRMGEGQVTCDFSVRSSVDGEKDKLVSKLEKLTREAGGICTVSGMYPGWKYTKDSPLREKMVSVYKRMYGTEPKVEAIHAGVECGLLAEKIPDLDCVSFGPDILDVHTVNERMDIASVLRVWKYILAILSEKEG